MGTTWLRYFPLWRGFPFHDPRATRQRRGGKGHGGTRSLRWVIVVDRGNLLGRGLFWLLKVHVFTLTYTFPEGSWPPLCFDGWQAAGRKPLPLFRWAPCLE